MRFTPSERTYVLLTPTQAKASNSPFISSIRANILECSLGVKGCAKIATITIKIAHICAIQKDKERRN